MKQTHILPDVMIMRPIVIVLLVLMHSFTIYTGGAWKLPDGIHYVPAYNWLTKITFSFLLETFIFISGYLLRAQFERSLQSFRVFVQKKAKRLLLPSILFSIFYFLMFVNYTGFGKCLLSIIEGCGHLWYLPMSFWCFVGGFLLYKLKFRSKIKLLICVVLACCSGGLGFLPLRLNSAAYYILFFYLGMLIYEKRFIFQNIRLYQVALFCIGYSFAFIILRPWIVEINSIGGG